MNKFPRMALIFLLLAPLAGCGAKGPLFLPEKPASQEVPADEAEPPADEADATDGKQGEEVPPDDPVPSAAHE